MINSFQWLAMEPATLPTLNFPALETWLCNVAKAYDRIVGELSYIFVDDEKILEVNRQYLQHDYYTDIITFDDTRGRLLRGDMFISLDTVVTNAQAVGADYNTELLRVIVHGLLHLCGINDKGPGEREIMETHENTALAMLGL